MFGINGKNRCHYKDEQKSFCRGEAKLASNISIINTTINDAELLDLLFFQ